MLDFLSDNRQQEMFTGIIKETGIIARINHIESGYSLVINTSAKFYAEVEIKSNIAVNGRPLTVLQKSIDKNQKQL